MKLSAPIPMLKRKARLLARTKKIPLHQALDQVAADEGFAGWSLLAARAAAVRPATRLFARLAPGDMVLLGARPGQGKTLMGLELAVEAMKSGHRGSFFTLEYTEKQVLDRFRTIGADRQQFGALFELDSSDTISAAHIARRMAKAPRGTLVVIDYLQLLDQKRDNPELMEQVRTLRALARDKGLIMVMISQVDRSYDPSAKPVPDLGDVRLPNPLDLKLFDKACFLNQGEVRFQAV
ncbi:replicative DNA helicase [Aminobacter lissarensis]|uniref:Replicative DNA helicase n=1 Tax=Aminobacter carboxidus TaxID=376165 RepID=A0A8E1WD15_9HYPH|nr:DNA helicase [Aminobacter lissarensis]MBB6465365.1 replicative DNA helicase [Aminobacter lissarensis]